MVTPDALVRNHKNLKEWYFLTKTSLKIIYNCILMHSVAYDHLYDFIFVQKYFITYSLLLGIFSRIQDFSAKFGNSKSVWAHVTD